MKKMIAMLLALVMVMSLVACGNKNEVEATEPVVEEPAVEATEPVVEEPTEEVAEPEVEAPAAESSAQAVFQKIWDSTGDDEKFFVMGGDSVNPVDGAPGVVDHTNVDELNYLLLVPAEQAVNIDDAAGMVHAMMLNNFRGGVFHVTGDAKAFADAMYEAIGSTQWMCGFPDSMLIAVIDGGYVLVAVGINDIMNPFSANVQEAYPNVEILYQEAIA